MYTICKVVVCNSHCIDQVVRRAGIRLIIFVDPYVARGCLLHTYTTLYMICGTWNIMVHISFNAADYHYSRRTCLSTTAVNDLEAATACLRIRNPLENPSSSQLRWIYAHTRKIYRPSTFIVCSSLLELRFSHHDSLDPSRSRRSHSA
jgi:hypothetical protein